MGKASRVQGGSTSEGEVAPTRVNLPDTALSAESLTVEDLTVTEMTVVGDAEINGALNHDGTTVGFYGVTPVARPSAYTQTFSTASRTVAAYTADAENAAYTGLDNLQAGSPYAKLTDLNALRVAYENLRAHSERTTQVLNAVIDDLQAQGLLQ